MSSPHILYSSDIESEQPNEAADIEACLKTFATLRERVYKQNGHAFRDAHAKSHGLLKGTLAVNSDLPAELAQGMFETPVDYEAIVRYSTAPGEFGHDGVAALRGLSLKVLGVPGPRLSEMFSQVPNQDLLLVNHPTISSGTVSAYRKQVSIIEKVTGLPPTAQRASTAAARLVAAGLRRVTDKDVAGGAGGQAKPLTDMLGETFYSTAALRYGNYVAKVGLFPTSAALLARKNKSYDSSDPIALRKLVADHFLNENAVYELRVQLCTNLDQMPVEDASVRWPEEKSPYRTVAILTLPAQDLTSSARRVYGDDSLTFSPFNGIEAHRPLGSIMRVRKAAYEESSKWRHEMNDRPMVEPQSSRELPD